MIKKASLFIGFCFILSTLLVAQVPAVEVPDEIEFAGMQLKITKGAKELLQKDITLLSRNSKYFQSSVDKANLYFPIIEKVLEEESFPKDFKYLPLQESSLIADAVSKSNAVGYWQFKKESAIEVGLRVDNQIDERMNIVSSTRGAARYLKRNNQTFNNWVYSLLSYNLGLGGAKSQIDQSNVGASKMTIDEKTHWYVIRFLAHKLIYQNAIGNATTVDTVLVEYINGANKSLGEIAQEYNLDKTQVEVYNKWLKTSIIPTDKIYSVVLAVPMSQARVFEKKIKVEEKEKVETKTKKEKYPSIAEAEAKNVGSSYVFIINGAKAVMARTGDNSVRLAAKGNLTKDEFLRYNEMKSFEDIIPGRIYYLSHKKNKAMVMFHTVQYGESIWDIAQNYGIKMETIREKNRMDENEAVDAGRVLWLRSKRPKSSMVEYKQIEHKKIETPKTIVPEIKMDTLVKKVEVLKTTDNIFATYDNTTKRYVVDSAKYAYTVHTVLTGETLFGISRLYSVPTDSLVKWNNLTGYGIKLSQDLIVQAKPRQPEYSYHTVATGDTFYKIAKQYNLTVVELQQLNGKTDLSLKIGERLVVKKSQN